MKFFANKVMKSLTTWSDQPRFYSTLEVISSSTVAIDLTALMKEVSSKPEFLRRYIVTC
jgi:hypothetical protein